MLTTRFCALVLRPVRFLVVAFACTMLLFSSAFPAIAAGMTAPSKPQEGETVLKKVYEESENSLREGPSDINETVARANRGLNEVQADADLDKMNNPANSQEAVTFKDRVKDALEKVTPGND